MHNKHRLIRGGLIALALLLVLVFFVNRVRAPEISPTERTYTGHGISFVYPDTYTLREYDVDTTQRYHYSIVLVENSQTNRDLLDGKIVGEGPTAITIDVFQNNLDTESLNGFVVGNNNSNFKLSDGTYKQTTATRARVPALSYTWDGLYRGDSVVFAHESKDNILMASVTYLTPNDQIRADFKKVLASLTLE